MIPNNKNDHHEVNNANYKTSFIKFIMTVNIQYMVTGPILFSFLLILIWAFIIGKWIFPHGVPQNYNYLVLGIGAFISGLGGLAQIIRREAPGPFGNNKVFAIIGGMLMFSLFWVAGVVLISSALSK